MSKSSRAGALTSGAETMRAPRAEPVPAAAHRRSVRDLKPSLEEEDWRARLAVEKVPVVGFARVPEAPEIAVEYDVVAAIVVVVECSCFRVQGESVDFSLGFYNVGI